MYDITRLLPQEQFEMLVARLPTPRNKTVGRHHCEKEALVNGILQVLRLGIGWNKIFDCGCSSSSCWRYFQECQRRGIFKKEFTSLSKEKTDISECAVDTNSTTSFRFSVGVGYDGRHKKPATKISALSDKHGLPVDIELGRGNRSDPSFLDCHVKNTKGRRKKVLNLDKIYVSLQRRRQYRSKGIKINMEMRKKDYMHKKGPKFRVDKDKYKCRFLIERLFAWIENFKRCKARVDRKFSSFKGFVYLAAMIILIRN